MKYRLLLLLILLSQFIFAQNTIDLNGQIIDSESGQVIPYVNIGLPAKNIGTVSNEEGMFNLYAQEAVSDTDIIQISSIGYKTKQIKLGSI